MKATGYLGGCLFLLAPLVGQANDERPIFEAPAKPLARPAAIQEAYNELVASSRLWPTHVTTHQGFEQPIFRDGKQIGAITIRPGTALALQSVKPEGIWIRVGTETRLLPLEQTDLMDRIPARRAEVEAIEMVQFERLRERGEQPLVLVQREEWIEDQRGLTVIDQGIPAPRYRDVRYAEPWYFQPPVYHIIWLPQQRPCPPRYCHPGFHRPCHPALPPRTIYNVRGPMTVKAH